MIGNVTDKIGGLQIQIFLFIFMTSSVFYISVNLITGVVISFAWMRTRYV